MFIQRSRTRTGEEDEDGDENRLVSMKRCEVMALGEDLNRTGNWAEKVHCVHWLGECGKTPSAVCPCCVLALVMLPVAR